MSPQEQALIGCRRSSVRARVSYPMAVLLATVLVIAAIFLPVRCARAFPLCAWPVKTFGTQFSNVAYPDTDATYWMMAFDAAHWDRMIIQGKFPRSRFMSFASYDMRGAAIATLFDFQIEPDAGAQNPFRAAAPVPASAGYTIAVAPDTAANAGVNHLATRKSKPAWIIYRVYLPERAVDAQSRVKPPAVTLVGRDGSRHPLPPCNFDPAAQAGDLFGLELNRGLDFAIQRIESAATDSAKGAPPKVATAPADRVIFVIPKYTGEYFANSANNYIVAGNLHFQAERAVVVRGKAPVFPDTRTGAPVSGPIPGADPVQLRYWSMCSNDQRAPYPVVACRADYDTRRDHAGFYTYVLSPPETGAGSPTPPAWLTPEMTWLPWGSAATPNILILRNMLPAPGFHQSVQAARRGGCAVNNMPGKAVSRRALLKAGQCAHRAMGPYYPVAAYCSTPLLRKLGWRGCFAAAGLNFE